MTDYLDHPCPRCGSNHVTVTLVGTTLTDGKYDDANHAVCEACKHRGKVGDWQRIAELRECNGVD